METFEDLQPRTKKMLVGTTALTVKELKISAWSKLWKAVRETVRVGEVISGLSGHLKDFGGELTATGLLALLGEAGDTLGEIAEKVLNVVIEDVPLLAKLGLLNDDNLKKLGLENYDELETYIEEEMTVRQHFAVAEAVIETNDFKEVLGKYMNLGKEALSLLGTQETPEEVQVEASD
jgi:hypothetical protein